MFRCADPRVPLVFVAPPTVAAGNSRTQFIAIADDMFIGDALPDLYDVYATKVRVQFERLGLHEQVSKAALISPKGDLSGAPAAIPDSPHSEVGVLKSFKAVGTEFGEPDDSRRSAKILSGERGGKSKETEVERDARGSAGCAWAKPFAKLLK